jgi:gas vesicle protein
MKGFQFLIFVILTFCAWGLYGPLLHVGQGIMGGGEGKSMLRPFICVGVAYFLIAVLFPIFVLLTKGEKGHWSVSGFFWSFVAGAVGAIGALGIILAFKFNGKPSYVMPLVFGLAPIVNTFVTMLMARTFKQASAVFYLGILIVAIGAAGVLIFKPTKAKVAEVDEPATALIVVDEIASQHTSISAADDTAKATDDAPTGSLLWVALSVALTAVCWGAYGPVLHKGQARMGNSRLRPFLCVGLAYFAIAVIGPLFMLSSFQEPGGWSPGGDWTGIPWSLGAGAAGAIGALGIIYAFNFGGKPLFIMPLVFGFAPVVNTLTTIVTDNLFGRVNNMFFASLAMVIIGAVMVLVFAPRAKPAATKPASDEPKSEA